MANVKTAISLQKPLFEQAEALAQQMKISRSRLFALALDEYLRRRENQQLWERINRAYEGPPDVSEQKRLGKMRRGHRKAVQRQW